MTETVATNNDVLTEENKQLILCKKQQKRKISYLTQRIQKLHQERKNENLVTTINKVLKGVRYDKRANKVLDLMYSGDLFGASGTAVGELFARNIMKKKFPAWKLCKAKDTSPQGCLNLQGLGQIRCVEELEKGEQGLFASKSTIWREGDELLRKEAFPLLVDEQNYHQKHQLGDTVQVDYEKLIRFMLEDNGLTEIAALFSILIGFSLDGGSLTSMTSHIFAGAKSLDLRSMKNGKLIFKDVDENGDEIFCNVQSNTNIYLMKLAYVKDGKEPYELYFRDWFQFVQKLKKYGLPARPDRGWKIVQPVQVCLPQDTSSIQKAIGMGGACKACDLFCHACACTSYGPKSMLLFLLQRSLALSSFLLE